MSQSPERRQASDAGRIVPGEKQIVRRSVPENALRALGDLHPVLARVYAARGIGRPADFDRRLEAMLGPDRLDGVTAAAERLSGAIEQGERLLVVGDFDADGATASALFVLVMRALGATRVNYLVPNRFEFGYGLTPEIVELAAARRPDLIVTVDNGVASLAGVDRANALGIPVIVTDHHLPGERLPAAEAIVNPNLPGSDFPSKALAGVGVIFYVLLGVRARLRDAGWFRRGGRTEPRLSEYLDLVALGTVADVVPLDRNNRILVHHGLRRIRAGRCRPGISALLRIAGRSAERLQASDLGFVVGPRLNAAGRLDDMSVGIECLITDSEDRAMELAHELDRLNKERRQIERDMQQQALALLDASPDPAAVGPVSAPEQGCGLCLFDEGWHQGVIGILAARLKERYHRPVIAFAPAEGGEIKGSARSIPGLHIRDALADVAARHPELLRRFGGHAMAAGLSLRRADLPAFAQAFERAVRRQLSPEDLQPQLFSDGEIPPSELTLALALELREAGPWGQGFPAPVFDGEFDCVSQRIVGERHWKLVLRPVDGTGLFDAIAFHQVERFPRAPARLRAAYQPDVNEYRGERRLQLIIEHMEAL